MAALTASKHSQRVEYTICKSKKVSNTTSKISHSVGLNILSMLLSLCNFIIILKGGNAGALDVIYFARE